MKWENLKEKRCPHCEADLTFDSGSFEVECTRCRFHMTPQRFKEMSERRTYQKTGEPYKKLYWQNIKVGRCPECNDDLNDDGQSVLIRCVRAECTFKCTREKMMDILSNPTHSANLHPL